MYNWTQYFLPFLPVVVLFLPPSLSPLIFMSVAICHPNGFPDILCLFSSSLYFSEFFPQFIASTPNYLIIHSLNLQLSLFWGDLLPQHVSQEMIWEHWLFPHLYSLGATERRECKHGWNHNIGTPMQLAVYHASWKVPYPSLMWVCGTVICMHKVDSDWRFEPVCNGLSLSSGRQEVENTLSRASLCRWKRTKGRHHCWCLTFPQWLSLSKCPPGHLTYVVFTNQTYTSLWWGGLLYRI